jgi:hypothetical protein
VLRFAVSVPQQRFNAGAIRNPRDLVDIHAKNGRAFEAFYDSMYDLQEISDAPQHWFRTRPRQRTVQTATTAAATAKALTKT